MDRSQLLRLLRHGNQLKRTARTGWVQRGIADAENVAAHSYGVAYAVLVLAAEVQEPIDLGKALTLALLHDLPESLTSDIPTPAARFLPDGAKNELERGAMAELASDTPIAGDWIALWQELQDEESAEARLVHDADKLDLYLQAAAYQEQTGNRLLKEFWAKPAVFHFPAAQALYEILRRKVSE
jgi:putative hydrolase of HD superfamily